MILGVAGRRARLGTRNRDVAPVARGQASPAVSIGGDTDEPSPHGAACEAPGTDVWTCGLGATADSLTLTRGTVPEARGSNGTILPTSRTLPLRWPGLAMGQHAAGRLTPWSRHRSIPHMSEPAPKPEIDALRARLDRVDDQLIELLAHRFELTQQVGCIKAELGLGPIDPEREARQQQRFRRLAEARALNPDLIVRIFRAVIDEVVANHEAIARDARRQPG